MGPLSPHPWNLTLLGQNTGPDRAATAALHSGTWVSAPVAFLRRHILCPGAHTLSRNGKLLPKNFTP